MSLSLPAIPKRIVPDIRRKTAQGMATLAARYGLAICMNVSGTVMLSRRLGPAVWGVFAVVQLIGLGSQEVLGRGMAAYLIKKEGQPTAADIRTTFALQTLLGLIATFGIMAAAGPAARWYGRDELQLLLKAAGLAACGYACRSVPLALLERDFEYGKVAAIEILENIVFYAVAISLVWREQVMAGLALAVIFRSWGPTLLALLLKPVRPALHCCRSEIAAIADFGFSVAASSLVNLAVFSVPAIFVGKLSGMRELGKAQISLSLYSNLLFVTAAVARLNLSAYSRLVEHSAEFAETVNQHLRVLAASLAPAIVLFAGLSPVWTTLVFGPKWQGLATVLLAQAPGYLLAAVFWGVLSPALLVSGRHRYLLYWLIGFAVVYGTLTRWLSPALGATGAAIAFSIAELALHPLLFWMYGNIHAKLPYAGIFPELLIGAGFLGLIGGCSERNLWAAIASVALYALSWCRRNAGQLKSIKQEFDFARWGEALNDHN